jgi:voltage-gated potassium channel
MRSTGRITVRSSAVEDTKPQELAGTGYEIFVGALSLLSIVNIVLVAFMRDPATPNVIYAVDWVLSIIFLGDFLMRLRRAPSGWDYFLRQFGWADLLASLPFPQVKILRVFRLIRVIRLLRQYGLRQIGASLLKDRASSALLSLLLIAILVLEFGSLWMLHIESPAPDANITTASDALWYVIVTMSTVGYGDQYPVTNAGRELGAVIIVVGVGIFGTLTGYLANLFLSPTKSEEAAAAEPAATLPDAGAAIDLRLARLARAGELRASGVMTMTEFETAKAEIMSS